LSEQALCSKLFDFVADSMRGRAAGLAEKLVATSYITREFAAAGLRPAGEHGSSFQELPLSRRALDSASHLFVNDRRIAPFTEYLPRDGGRNARQRRAFSE
jgi:hypothetical protein